METTTGAVRHAGPHLSHQERDACLHALGALHASGTLSLAELDARIGAALAARTTEELAALVRESSGVEVSAQQPTREEPRAAVVRRSRPGGAIVAQRLIVFVALTLPVALVRVLATTAIALCVGLVRLLHVTAWGGRCAYRALVHRSSTWHVPVGRAQAGAVPARLQTQRSVSRELVLMPQPQVPAQREPAKIHPVLVPTEAGSTSTALVLAARSTDVVLAGRPAIHGEVIARDLASVGRPVPREARRVREIVAHLRPIVHRVMDQARSRRRTTGACERAALSKRGRRAMRLSRTAF